MKDFIVRLASMKLAEMKFDVVVKTQFVDSDDEYSLKLTLREIKKEVEDMNPIYEDLYVEEYPKEHSSDSEKWSIYQEVDKLTNKEIIITRPKNLTLAQFYRVLKSLGLTSENKIRQMIKKNWI
jgi:hypothetical protein